MKELRYEILSRFEEISDPRVEPTKVHSLPTLLFIALCTFLTGGKSFYEMELFAQAHKTWLKKVAGMVNIGGDAKVVFARVRQRGGGEKCFYVHEVFTEEQIKEASKNVQATDQDQLFYNSADFYKNLIACYLEVKETEQEQQG